MQSCPPRWREGGTLSFLLIGENKLVVTPTEKDPPPQKKTQTPKQKQNKKVKKRKGDIYGEGKQHSFKFQTNNRTPRPTAVTLAPPCLGLKTSSVPNTCDLHFSNLAAYGNRTGSFKEILMPGIHPEGVLFNCARVWLGHREPLKGSSVPINRAVSWEPLVKFLRHSFLIRKIIMTSRASTF